MSNDRGDSKFRSNSRVSTNRDRLRCYRCGEPDHFAKECPNTPMDDELVHSASDQGMLQMIVQEEIPVNCDGEVEYLNL